MKIIKFDTVRIISVFIGLTIFLLLIVNSYADWRVEQYKERLLRYGADESTLSYIGGGEYFKDKDKIFNLYKGEIKGLDLTTFTFYSGSTTFSYDKNNNYFKHYKISPRLVKILPLSINCGLVSDNRITCYKEGLGNSPIQKNLVGERKGELKEIEKSVFKDEAYVYNLSTFQQSSTGYIISQDPFTFAKLNYKYFKDTQNVYYHLGYKGFTKIEGADPATFKVFSDWDGQGKGTENNYSSVEYASDKNKVYYQGKVQDSLNPETFDVNKQIQQNTQIRQELDNQYTKKIRNKLFIISFGIFLFSFCIYLFTYHTIVKNKGIIMPLKQKLLIVFGGSLLATLISYQLSNSNFSFFSSGLASILITSTCIIGITKKFYPTNIRFLKDSIYLGLATIILTFIIGGIFGVIIYLGGFGYFRSYF